MGEARKEKKIDMKEVGIARKEEKIESERKVNIKKEF